LTYVLVHFLYWIFYRLEPARNKNEEDRANG